MPTDQEAVLQLMFDRLDRWRHLPNYQLERRIDIFFSIYLTRIMERHTNVLLKDTIIPELPIKRDLIWPDKPSYKSVKVDYVLFSADGQHVYFVELKTDRDSRREEQDEYLLKAASMPFRRIVGGIVEIARKTSNPKKYYHLICLLEAAGVLSLPQAKNENAVLSETLVSRSFAEADIADIPSHPEVFYIQPSVEVPEEDVITFSDIIRCLTEVDDGFSHLFTRYLERWITPAGEQRFRAFRTGRGCD